MGAIETLLERNARAARPLAPASPSRLCVVTCDDAALTGQLETCVGLNPGDAVIVRLPAGGGGLSQEIVQRAVAKAVLVDGCDEVLLLTHAWCTLYNLSVTTLIDGLARARIPRAAVPYDLRELVGAGRDPRQSVMESAALLRQCPFLPSSLLVHVAHFDEATGKLQLVEHGEGRQISRPEDAARHVAGYQPGPAAPSEPQLPAPALPSVFFAEPPPLAAAFPAPSTPVPPSLTRAKQATATPRPARSANTALPPGLVESLDKIRAFVGAQLGKGERRKASLELTDAARNGRPLDDQLKIAFNPIMKVGDARYPILDDMLLVKDELAQLPASKATELLQSLLR